MNKENSLNYPTVGIIVPIYNTEKYVGRCLNSILNNTYSNIKVFCIDDGSKDESSEIVEKIAKNDSRVILIRQENGGLSVARNRGLEAAFKENCEVIGFVDSDDWVHPQYIENLLSGILDGYDVSVCDYFETDKLCEDFNNPISKSYVEIEFENLDKNQAGAVWCHLYRSECIENIRFCDDVRYGEDVLFHFMLLSYDNSIKMCWTEQKLYYYFQRADSIVHRFCVKDVLYYEKNYCFCYKNRIVNIM